MGTLRLMAASVLLLLRPMLVIGGWVLRRGQQVERQTVYILGVRDATGDEHQARIEGEPMGAMPRRGDYVSLWGSPRHGVLVIRNGYNHSVGGEIRIR